MIIKKIFYCLAIMLSLNEFVWSMEKKDSSGEHPEVLMEDLVNLTDADLEFKDSDQLELLLSEIDTSIQDPQNDFEGEFNVPEITDHINDGIPGNIRFGSKIADLKVLKQDIEQILKARDFELGPRD